MQQTQAFGQDANFPKKNSGEVLVEIPCVGMAEETSSGPVRLLLTRSSLGVAQGDRVEGVARGMNENLPAIDVWACTR